MQTPELDQVVAQAMSLSSLDKVRLMGKLAASLEHELAQKSDWHTFLRETYGILADDPIERPAQGDYEEREPFE